jgi:hypothetical protein
MARFLGSSQNGTFSVWLFSACIAFLSAIVGTFQSGIFLDGAGSIRRNGLLSVDIKKGAPFGGTFF